jgi:acyl-CoA thioesterase
MGTRSASRWGRLDALTRAQAVGQAMLDYDAASKAWDMRLEEISPGYARMRMTVRPEMLNGHGTCHGGFIFLLADSAFAYACNSHGRVSVAAGCNIEYLNPVQVGQDLLAEAIEQGTAGRGGVYDVTIHSGAGELIACFRGRSAERRETWNDRIEARTSGVNPASRVDPADEDGRILARSRKPK